MIPNVSFLTFSVRAFKIVDAQRGRDVPPHDQKNDIDALAAALRFFTADDLSVNHSCYYLQQGKRSFTKAGQSIFAANRRTDAEGAGRQFS
ncbi:hypothetical protein GCM10008018_17370 [Paenibacillus marchantiophytorum]|uniref:Uncharacterized protein n=1 Tax=Paenibacillus marchantiophytorum TaxID=1619310 RepID=A0ABQ2BV45_9BACL|nr:hypothetical protein GCM10008018_17370 [Paenibacillus marchantiophytorum]